MSLLGYCGDPVLCQFAESTRPGGLDPKERTFPVVSPFVWDSTDPSGTRPMKRARRQRQRVQDKFARLQRHLEICLDLTRPRRVRTRSARYAAALAEQLGLIERQRTCTWCRRHRPLERHHWDYLQPLLVTYLCTDCHVVADRMPPEAASA